MKTIYTILLVAALQLTVFSSGLNSKNTDVKVNRSIVNLAFKTVPQSLNSDIPGVVESSIYNSILLKKRYPSEDFSDLIEILNNVAVENEDPSIRFKAHLASIYLNFSDVIDVQPLYRAMDREYIFKQIVEQIGNDLAAGN